MSPVAPAPSRRSAPSFALATLCYALAALCGLAFYITTLSSWPTVSGWLFLGGGFLLCGTAALVVAVYRLASNIDALARSARKGAAPDQAVPADAM